MPDDKKTLAGKIIEIMEGRTMSFREKMAFVSLFALCLASFCFAGMLHVVHQQGGDMHGGRILGLIIGMAVLLIAGHSGGAIWAAVSNLEDAREPADERDWQTAARAGHAGGLAMASLLGIAVFAYFTGASKEHLVQLILANFLFSGIVSNGAKIYLYRAGL